MLASLSVVSRDSTKPMKMIAEQENDFWTDYEKRYSYINIRIFITRACPAEQSSRGNCEAGNIGESTHQMFLVWRWKFNMCVVHSFVRLKD